MHFTKKETLRKKSIKWTLMILEVILFTVFGMACYFLFVAESYGYWFGTTTFEDSDPFYRTLSLEIDEILNNVEEQNDAQKYVIRSYQEGNSNLTYVLLLPDQKKIYSNKKAYDKYSDFENYIEEMRNTSWYMVFHDSLADSEIFENGKMAGYYWTLLERFKEPFIFAFSVDTDYPIPDVFFHEMERYQMISGWILPAIGAVISSAVLCVMGLIFLTIGAGRVSGEEDIRLNWFDRIYTEISATLVFCVWITGCLLMTEELRYSFGKETMIVVIGMISFYTMFWFLIGYLSLVRRIKAKTLWKASLLNACRKGILKMWNGSTGTVKRIGAAGGKYPLTWIRRVYGFLKKTGNTLLRFVKIGFLDNLSDLAKICMLFALFLLIRFFLNLGVVNRNAIAFCIVLVLDPVVLGFMLYYLASELRIKKAIRKIEEGELDTKIEEKGLIGYQKEMAQAVNQIGDGMQKAILQSIKDERMKTELITNVSHDIKTPLTSIINYVDLLKREEIQDTKIQGYISVLEEKAQRLKVLTEDVVEASKASTGNITLEMMDLDLVELIRQVAGEYEEKLKENGLLPVFSFPEEPVMIYADGRRMWRVLSNLFGNIAKYAQEGTRVYADLKEKEEKAELIIRNISREPLNISAGELTERFVRGDGSRTTEGSGLGLSIAKSFTELMGGTFGLSLDGDLFKVTLTFPVKKK